MHLFKPAAVACLLLAIAGPALAHTRLTSSEPQAGATIAAAPGTLRVAFSEPVEAPFSKVSLSFGGSPVALPKAQVDKDDPRRLSVPLPALAPGQYQVQWSVVTRDGHKMRGEFGFRVGK